MPDIFGKLLSAVMAFPWRDLGSALGKLFSEQKWVVILATTFLAAAVFSASVYWRRGNELESIVNDSLQASLEETPQQHKGLEAFLMTSLNQQARNHATKPLVDFIKTANLSTAFTDRFNQFKQKLQTINPTDCPVPKLTIAQGYESDIVFTDTSSVGFLFAPLRLFRPSYTDEELFTFAENQGAKEKNEADITKFMANALQQDPFLKTDICVSRTLARETHQFTEVAILDRDSLGTAAQYIDITPRQTYLISRSGLNRIFLRSPNATQAYYASQFRATTFFPSRPYFWPAFGPNTIVTDPQSMITTIERASSFFHITQPYMDLGGNGIVITLSKGFRVPGITEFALCFDLAFEADAGLQTSLKHSVDRFDGHLTEVTCHLNDNSSTCEANHPGRAETAQDVDLREALTKALRDAVKEGQQDKVFGNILVLPPLWAQERQDVVLASIPVGKVSIDNVRRADKSADFLVVEFDFFQYRRVTTLWGIVAASSFFLAVSVLGFFLTRTIFRSREFEDALKRITFVMDEAPTPFVWLDHEDSVVYANAAFWELTGRITGTKFTLKSLITPETVASYNSAQKHRTDGEDVAPYEVTIRHTDGTELRIRIRSMDVPSLRRKHDALPETFGVFLVLHDDAQAAAA